MNKIKLIAGIVTALVMVSTMGIMVIAQDAGDTSAGEDIDTDSAMLDDSVTVPVEEMMPLITIEQQSEIGETVSALRNDDATRTEMRETARSMFMDYVLANLEEYGLTDSQISEIEDKILELQDKQDEIRETAEDLWEQDMNHQAIQEKLEPLMEEAQNIHVELAELLYSYGILPPMEMQGPGPRMMHNEYGRMDPIAVGGQMNRIQNQHGFMHQNGPGPMGQMDQNGSMMQNQFQNHNGYMNQSGNCTGDMYQFGPGF